MARSPVRTMCYAARRAKIEAMSEPLPEPRLGRIALRWRPWFDVAIAAVLWVLTTLALFARDHLHGLQSPSWFAFVVAALATWPLALRTVRPHLMIGCVIAAVALNGVPSGTVQVTSIPLAIAMISFASRQPLRETLVAATAALVALILAVWFRGATLTLAGLGSRVFAVAAMTAVGLFLGARRAYSQQLRERARGLERERGLLAERAVDEERVRIARELHDAIAHHVSLLVVQAGAIRESLPHDSPTRSLADSMAATGRQALEEMRSMLGLLRTSRQGNAVERTPQPGLADLRALVEQTRRAELDAELEIEGVERPVPVGIDLSAYRIVQESLTNVIKHADAASARVLVRYLPNAVELEITDNGRGQRGGPTPSANGHGIVGMRERVALYGGELEAGPASGGGWRVHAVLPLESRQ
jgi:signal transduction histidine kinase